MGPKLTIQIVGWNSSRELGSALEALGRLSGDEVVVRYIDNASEDGSVELVRRMLPTADIVELNTNTGFSGGHNTGFDRCDTPLVMVHNPDLVIDWSGIKKILEVFDDEKVGAAQGILFREAGRTVIDSAGVKLSWTLNGMERGAGEPDVGQFSVTEDIHAVTGAAGIYRLSALREVSFGENEVLDTDFFAYKEDVDLGWRLTNRGWKVLFVPIAMGVHERSFGKGTDAEWKFSIRGFYNRLSDLRTRYSLRNWIWMTVKNATFKQMLLHELFFDARLLLFFLFSLLYWPMLSVWPETIRGLPQMIKKRNYSLDR